MKSISDRTQCTIAWLPVIILLRFAHVIFIEINVDKIINAFTQPVLCPCIQVKVGICIWLAKLLRMSRPEQQSVKRRADTVTDRRYSSLTPLTSSGGSCTASRRPQLTSATNKKSSSSSKKNDLFQQRSSRSLLANVLDLEDDFLLLNLIRRRIGQKSVSARFFSQSLSC